MSVIYQQRKGFLHGPKPHKQHREKFLTGEEVHQILDCVTQANSPNMRRDHCAIFLGLHLALRAGETVLLNRNTFRDIQHGIAHIRTLKCGERISYTCPGPDCHRKYRVAIARNGKTHECVKCGMVGTIPKLQVFDENTVRMPSGKIISLQAPEKEPPSIEFFVIEYIQDYMQNVMRPDQEWFLEGHPGEHICTSMLRKIFNTYAELAGLSSIYSWHSLRHGRGVFVYENNNDLIQVRDMLRQQSSQTAEIYTHLSPKRSAALRKQLEDGAGEIAVNPFKRLEHNQVPLLPAPEQT